MNRQKWIAVAILASLAGLNGEEASAQGYYGYPAVGSVYGGYPASVPYGVNAVPSCCPNGQCRFRQTVPSSGPAVRFRQPTIVYPAQRQTLPVLSEPRVPVDRSPSSGTSEPHDGFFSLDDQIGPPAESMPQRYQLRPGSPFYQRPATSIPASGYAPTRQVPARPATTRPTSGSPFYR